MKDKLLHIIKSEFEPVLDHGISLHLDLDNNHVGAGDLACSGYFDNIEKEIHVAIGSKDPKDWFTTFLHEYCHYRQWVEQTPEWIASQECEEKNSDDFLDQWLSGEIEYGDVEGLLRSIMLVELDCEKRTALLLDDYPEVIDVEEYIQKSNAYAAFYKQVLLKRKWYNPEKAPYLNKDIYLKMPTEFLSPECYWEKYEFDDIEWELCLGARK